MELQLLPFLIPFRFMIRKIFNYCRNSTATTVTGLFFILLVIGVGVRLSHAATLTSYDVTNEVTMYLDQSITTTQTTGINLSSPQLNGSNFVFATTTGGVLRIRSGNFREDIRFTGATINSTTNKVSLLGITRNLCPQVTKSYVSCGTGRAWGKGAIVELIQDARLFNLKANIDRANTFTASGAIAFVQNGSGSLQQPVYSTTTARDHNLGAIPKTGLMACSIDTGLCYDGIAGAWVARTASTVANAAIGVAGKVELPTLVMIRALTATGSTGAQNVVPVFWLVKNGSGSVSAGRVPVLNQNGVLSASFITTTSSGVLVSKTGTGLTALTATSSGFTLMTNQNGSWKASNNLGYTLKRTAGIDKIATSTGDQNFANTVVFPANSLMTGSVVRIIATGSGYNAGSSVVDHGLKLGSTELCRSDKWSYAASFERRWTINAVMTVQSNGANGKVQTDCIINEPGSDSAGKFAMTGSGSTATINTTTSNTVNVFNGNVQGTGFAWLIQLFAQFYQ